MNAAIFLAAGKGKRFGKQNKLFLPLKGEFLFLSALRSVHSHPAVHEIFITCKRQEMDKIGQIVRRENLKKVKEIILGGSTRQKSVFAALKALSGGKQKPEFLIIHNAANPFVSTKEIADGLNILKYQKDIDGVAVGRKITNTVKKSGKNPETISRENLWEIETPQFVRYKPFFEVHQKAQKENFETTDDTSLLERFGKKAVVIQASENNFKITTKRDYAFAKFLTGDLLHVTFGYGEDSHVFSRTHRGLRLGGVLLKNYPKLEADSDGDVILHALATALSQAIGGGSLGAFATPLFKKGITDSKKYVEFILRKIRAKKLGIQKINIVIEGAKPKIDPLAPKLKKSLGKILKIPETNISIAAHTGEGRIFSHGKAVRCAVSTVLTGSLLESSIEA